MIIEALQQFQALGVRALYHHQERAAFVQKYAWAIPDEKAVSIIAAHGPIVEIGAGTGYWSYLLRQVGADVVAYDVAPYKNGWCNSEKGWTEVLVGGTEKAAAHPDRALFLCWPPYGSPMAREALEAYIKAGGTTVIYVGELGGCTGDEEFHELLDRVGTLVDGHNIPSWLGINDELMVYRVR